MMWRPRSWSSGPAAKHSGLAVLLAAGVLTASCGGSGSAGMSGASAAASGSASASVAVGAITGFGSVHVNGRRFQTTAATITMDGKTAVQSDLHVGQVIEVRGHHDSVSDQDIAEQIDFRGNLEGPVTSIDATAQTLVVLGQTVQVTADTSFDDDISPASLAGIKSGDVAEVSGHAASDGSVLATRIERKPATAALQVIGTVSSVDNAAGTLVINDLIVSFKVAALMDFPASGPQSGDLVEVSGTALNSNGVLVATRIELRIGKDMQADVAGETEVEGLITRFGSAGDFDVASRHVMTSARTTFEGGTVGDLALNVGVEVEGTLTSAGLIAAVKVRIGHPADTRLTGAVDTLNATAGTVTVLGVQITTDAMTRFEDHGSQKTDTFSLADVHTGDWLEVRGNAGTSAGATVHATRIDRRASQAQVELSGRVAGITQPNFTILSTDVATSTATQFHDGMDAATFFNSAVGKSATVQGSWNGSVLSAQDVHLGLSE